MPQTSSSTIPSPVRRPIDGRSGAPRYEGWSPKMRRQVCFATRLEHMHWLLLEGTPEVTQFCEYYPMVHLESHEYVFDMWLRRRDGAEECREVVTPSAYGHRDGFALATPDWTVICSWGREHGYTCELVTEGQLMPATRRINNWRRILPFVRYALDKPDPALEQAVLLCLDGYPDMPLRELTRLLPDRGTEITAVVAKLLHAGYLRADLDRHQFGPNLLLRRARDHRSPADM